MVHITRSIGYWGGKFKLLFSIIFRLSSCKIQLLLYLELLISWGNRRIDKFKKKDRR